MIRVQDRGFSLAELLLSLGFIAIGVLTMIGLAVTSMRAGREATDSTTAVLVAQTELERNILAAQSDPNFWDNDHLATPYRSDSVIVDKTKFDYSIFAVTVMDGTDELGTSQGDDENRLKKVDIVVNWWDSGTQERQGYGKLEVRQTRLVAEVND